jgi:hypothetical protein
MYNKLKKICVKTIQDVPDEELNLCNLLNYHYNR